MGLKNYIISTVLLIILLFGFVYSLELGEYTLTIFGFSQTLPISVWIVLPVLFLVLVTYLHIVFYGLVNYFKIKLSEADQDNIIDLIKAKLLQKEHKIGFRTKRFKEISTILNQLDLNVRKDSFSSSNEDINKVVTSIQDVNNGIFIKEKELKSDENSDLYRKNLVNKINEQADFAVDIVKKADKYDSQIVKTAFLKALEDKSMTTIKKIYKNVTLDKEMACKLLEKDKDNSEFGFENTELVEIIKNLKFTKDEYLSIAKKYKNSLTPDKLIDVFEKLSNDDEEALNAYLYILNEFEMIDKLREILANTQDEEYLIFKALLDLKDAGKHYNLENLTYK